MTKPLSLIIRFSPPIDDLPLAISSPATTTPLNLHTLIRPHLPAQLAASPLRLISAGALLPPSTPLTLCLRRAPSPNPLFRPASSASSSKQPPVSTPEPIYIHCAITSTTTLSAAALAAEHVALISPPSTHPAPHTGHLNQAPQQQQQQQQQQQLPLGFDALLSAGLTPPEIASLRSQFQALHAHIHTPDTMPSAAEMRVLEERWLDTNTASGSAGGRGLAGGGGGALGNDGDDGEGAALEDMLWGTVMGFFWAVGAVGWLMREEGVWSGRRRGAVAMGVVVNLAVCLLRGFG